MMKASRGGVLAAFVFALWAALSAHAKPGVQPRTKAAMLKYPAFPQEVLDRATGAKSRNSVRFESKLKNDWGLTHIGFFESTASQPKTSTETCGREIIVAIVDTGIDYTHPELKDLLWVNRGETGKDAQGRDKSKNGADDDGNGFIDDVGGWDFVHDNALAYDTHGHGTHIAGIIASSAGIAGGVSTCPKISLMPLKYYDNSGVGYNNLTNTVRAIQYAVKAGAHIINYSGGGADPAAAERQAIEEARSQGVLFVAAAGNDGHNNDQTPYFPASYPIDNLIGVASINRANQLLPSSNFGKTVHIAAPGLMVYSTLPEGRFGTMSGTSQATAFVTGAAAMLAVQMGPSSFDYKKIKQWLTETSKPLKFNEKRVLLSGGLLSLPRALESQRADVSKPAIASPEIAVRARRARGANN